MSKDYKSFAADVDQRAVELFKAAPGTMRAFRGLMDEASKDGALSARVKELMALGIAIASRCEGCIVFHTKAAMKKGASREEVVETIAVAIEMGGGPSTVYGAEALAAFDQLAK
ncbi:MAG: carboxymuconolactone decarboxylase family protein [Alphaproteobacteria bacterium]|nr:carboxymuconolactone decarboxylase family protein [Alphaproteobacteria bacterium]